MLKIGILASTKATDMQAVIDAIESHQLDAKIMVLISDKKSAYCLERAEKHNIPAIYINPKEKSMEDFDKEAAELLDHNDTELVLMLGYMRIVSGWFVNRYKNRIINIHPSLLPDFAGGMDLNVHQQVIDAKAKVTGCTLHFVTESVDAGPIIMQKSVEVISKDTAGTLKEKVQKAEQEIIVKSLKLFSEGKIKVEEGKVIILP